MKKTKKMKIKDEIKDELFKNKNSINLTKENMDKFVDDLGKIAEKLGEQDREKKEKLTKGDDFKPEDVEDVANAVIMDIGRHLDHVDFLQMLVDSYKSGKMKHKPMYTKQGQVDKYKIELANLFHSLAVKLRMSMMFGFGEIEGVISVVDTKRLPNAKESKKLHKKEMRKMIDKATRASKDIDTKSTRLFKKKVIESHKK